MTDTLGCGHPDKNRACGDCLDEAEAEVAKLELQYDELRLHGQRAAGQLREVLKLGMYAPESFAHMRAAYESLKEFDKPITEKRECQHAWTPINLSPGFDSQCKKCGIKTDLGT